MEIISKLADSIKKLNDLGYIDTYWIHENLKQHLQDAGVDDFVGLFSFLSPLIRLKTSTKISKLVVETLNDLRDQKDFDVERRIKSWNFNKSNIESAAKFFVETGISECGFPIRGDNISSTGLNTVFGGLLYRFSYGPEMSLTYSEFIKSINFEGAYKVYLRRAQRDNFECRILALFLHPDDDVIYSVELSKAEDKFLVRFGPIVPSYDLQTAILSDYIDKGIAEFILEGFYDENIPKEDRVDLENTYPKATEMPIPSAVQFQNLLFYSFRHQGTNEIVGHFMQRGKLGKFVGRKLTYITTDDLQGLGMIMEENIENLPDQDRDILAQIKNQSVFDFSTASQIPEGPSC